MKPAVKYGLLNGGILILWSLLMYITGLIRNPNFQWVSILFLWFAIPITFMVIAIKEFKQTEGNGWILFGKAFKQSYLVGLIGGIICIIYFYFYITVIDVTYIDYQLSLQTEKLREKGLSEEMIVAQMQKVTPFMTPIAQLIVGIIIVIVIAALNSLIIAAILKKPNPEEIS